MDTFVKRFLNRVRQNPENSAVLDIRGMWTYQKLNNRSAYLAQQIQQHLAGKPARVALLLPRTKDYIMAELAVIRSGCAMVPIDGEYPQERVCSILSDARCKLCITVKERASEISDTDILLLEDVFPDDMEKEPECNPLLDASSPDAEGCILYTSGSTGKPKGVIHRMSMFNYPDVLIGNIPLSEKTRSLCIAGVSFVASQLDIITPLLFGGSVYMANETERKNMDMIYALYKKRRITGMFMPPAMYSVLRRLHGTLPLDYVLLAGEKVNAEDTCDAGVWELYGSTEVPAVLMHEAGNGGEGSLGKPCSGVMIYLLDEEGKKIDESGKIGELCVVSPYAASGYSELPAETAARFEKDPFGDGQTIVHTGDYMALSENGNLIFHGRQDRMVKIRGYRVELGEVEQALNRNPDIDEVAVINVKMNGGDKICCYYSGRSVSPEALGAFISESLPEYMIPEYFIALETIPRNERNKVDYSALKAMEVRMDEAPYEAPSTEAEARVCEAFAYALDLQKISVTADFFSCGGTSLSVAVLISALEDFNCPLSFHDVSMYPTPRALAAYLEQARDTSLPAMSREAYPLTRTQMGIYLESMTGGNKETYSSPYLIKAREGVTAEDLIRAAQKVIDVHLAMKYVIRQTENGLPMMVMIPDAEVEIPVIEGTDEGRMDFIKQFWPVVPIMDSLLFHLAVYRTPKRCYLAMKVHLIFFDGTSISRFIAEMNRAIGGQILLGENCTIQQAAMLEEHRLSDGTYDKAKAYYADLFHDVESMPSLSGDINGTLTAGISRNLRFEQNKLTVERVQTFCNELHISESSFFQGAMALMLGKYLNSSQVSFSTVYNGRGLSEMDNTLGTLIKRIPVYGDLRKDLPVKEYLGNISRQIFSSMVNDIYSFDEVLKTCPVNEDVEFIYQGDLFTDRMGTSDAENLLEGDRWFMEHYHTGMVTGCFSIQFFSTNGLYNMTVEYRNERFSEKWVKRFAQDLFTVAEQLLTCQRIGEITLMTVEDKATEAHFNDTALPIDFIPVHEQIHRHALRDPEKTAVVADGMALSFRELDLLSSQLASVLADRGIRPDDLIGVLFDREVWAYVAEIAILKAGAGFIPFIPDYPDERIEYCLRDSESKLILTTARQLEDRHFTMIGEDQILTLENAFSTHLSDIIPDETWQKSSFVSVTAENLAYCIYTSGSTGKPKGVMIEHRNIANYVHRNEKSVEIMHYATPDRINLALASLSFDVSVVEEFVPLCNGNTVVMATEAEIHDPTLFAELVRNNHVNGITCTPTYLLSLLEMPVSREAIEQITFFDIGAEAFPRQLYDKLRTLRGDSVILNVYGPTECTMGCSAAVMTDDEVVTVGKPIANTAFYVADPFGNPLPVGMKGELIICGDQVGRGYVNLPDKTAAAFFIHNGVRAYHSGDLAAWTEDGEIRIFGRIDNQIKLRGFRIELDEIEKVIAEYPGVSCGAVCVRKGGAAEYLAGYFTSSETLDIDKIKAHMQEKLPPYMVPTVLIPLDAMPMTTNGKVNRKALPEPDAALMKAEFIPPETETQKRLCAAFEKALHLEEGKVGLLDDFFEMGGDSLKAMMLLVEADLDGLTGADIFQLRTPDAIARELENRVSRENLDTREEKARMTSHMLTPMQTEMMDIQLFHPESTVWSNMHFLLHFGTDVDAQRLCDAVNTAIHQHPGLSVAFYFDDNCELRWRYMPELLPDVEVKEIVPGAEQMLPDVLVRPFDRILNACLCRVNVFKSQGGCYLFMDVHHLLMDGTSLGVLLQDITDAYFGRELKKDYYCALAAEEEKKILGGARKEDEESFWNYYGSADWCSRIQPDYPGKGIGLFSRIERMRFGEAQIQKAEKRWKVSLSVMAITAGLIALSKITGEKNVMINWIFNNRLLPESEHVVGMLIKNMPAALRMGEITSMQEALFSVREQTSRAIANNTYDYLAETYQPYLSDSVEVNLQLGINGEEMDELPYEFIQLSNPFTQAASTQPELELLVNEYKDGGYDSEIEYPQAVFKREKMDAFHQLYIRILESIITGEDTEACFHKE